MSQKRFTKMVLVSFDPPRLDRLDEYCTKMRRTRSSVVEEAVDALLGPAPVPAPKKGRGAAAKLARKEK